MMSQKGASRSKRCSPVVTTALGLQAGLHGAVDGGLGPLDGGLGEGAHHLHDGLLGPVEVAPQLGLHHPWV